jgi:hypothetical protein
LDWLVTTTITFLEGAESSLEIWGQSSIGSSFHAEKLEVENDSVSLVWKRRAIAPMLVSVLAGAGCGGGKSPAAPSPTVTTITVTSSTSMMLVGASEVFTATATLSNGATQPVTTGTWGSDASQVAQVEAASGRVTGAGGGEVTIFVDFQGARGSKRIRVVPDYQGNWLGSYVVSSCSQTGGFAAGNACGSTFPNNAALPLQFQFTQSADVLSGRTSLGQVLSDNFSAPIATNGSVSVLVTATNSGLTFAESWNLISTQPGRISGTLRFVLTSTTLSGSVTVEANLINTNKQ